MKCLLDKDINKCQYFFNNRTGMHIKNPNVVFKKRLIWRQIIDTSEKNVDMKTIIKIVKNREQLFNCSLLYYRNIYMLELITSDIISFFYKDDG